jgi:hypothetical protein
MTMDLISSATANQSDFFILLTPAYSFQNRSFREAKEGMIRFHSSTYEKPYLIEATAQYLVAHLSSSARDV